MDGFCFAWFVGQRGAPGSRTSRFLRGGGCYDRAHFGHEYAMSVPRVSHERAVSLSSLSGKRDCADWRGPKTDWPVWLLDWRGRRTDRVGHHDGMTGWSLVLSCAACLDVHSFVSGIDLDVAFAVQRLTVVLECHLNEGHSPSLLSVTVTSSHGSLIDSGGQGGRFPPSCPISAGRSDHSQRPVDRHSGDASSVAALPLVGWR
jgi:hypothetical protein